MPRCIGYITSATDLSQPLHNPRKRLICFQKPNRARGR